MKNSKQITAIKVASIAVTAFAVSSGSVLAQGKSGNAPGQNKAAPPAAATNNGNGNGNGNSTPVVVTPPVVVPPVVVPPVVVPQSLHQ